MWERKKHLNPKNETQKTQTYILKVRPKTLKTETLVSNL
jgi:hypothetical protein